MKNNKLLTSLFVLGMGLSLVACGASDGGTTTKNKRHRKPHRIRQTMPTYSAVIILRCSPQTDRL